MEHAPLQQASSPARFSQLSEGAKRQLIELTTNRSASLARVENLLPEGPSVGVTIMSTLGVLMGVAAAFVLPTADFGNPFAIWAGQGSLLGHAFALFVATFSAMAFVKNRMRKAPPYRQGFFLTATMFVDAWNVDAIRVHRLSDLKQHYRRETWLGTPHIFATFTTPDGRNYEMNLGSEARIQPTLRALAERRVAGNEPLLNGPRSAPQVQRAPAWVRFQVPLALGIAVLAVPTWFVRNALSDVEAFDAMAADLERYRTRLLRYADDDRARFPEQARARVMQYDYETAVADRDLSSFLDMYPSAPMRDEATALHYQQAFEDLGAAPSASAYRQYIAGYPSAPQVREAQTRLADMYTSARNAVSSGSADAQRFLREALTHAEAHNGAPIIVRFEADGLSDLEARDSRNARRAQRAFAHHVSAAGVFNADIKRFYENAFLEGFTEDLGARVPADLMTLRHEGDAEGVAASPTIHLTYRFRPTSRLLGSYYVYGSFAVEFEARFELPGQGEVLRTSFRVEAPREIHVQTRSYGAASGTEVYGAILYQAFAAFREDLRDTLSSGVAATAPQAATTRAHGTPTARSASAARPGEAETNVNDALGGLLAHSMAGL
ncbi:MAG: hypothetical protein AAF411_03735 [Myxococcota bacterium]